MIKSLRSSCKEVAAIVPAKNVTGAHLGKMTREVIRILHEASFKVLVCIADNNYINGNAFKAMAGNYWVFFLSLT